MRIRRPIHRRPAPAALVAAPLALAATPALAHSGEHGGLAMLASLAHLLTEPDHLALIGAAIAAAWLLARTARRARRGARRADVETGRADGDSAARGERPMRDRR